MYVNIGACIEENNNSIMWNIAGKDRPSIINIKLSFLQLWKCVNLKKVEIMEELLYE